MGDLMPNILSQMGPNAIKDLLAQMQGKGGKGAPDLSALLGAMGGAAGGDDDDMPSLEEGADFEAVSQQ